MTTLEDLATRVRSLAAGGRRAILGVTGSPGAGKTTFAKHLVRLLVTSSAYRQSSRVTQRKYDFDPENRFLARGPRFRVDAGLFL